MLSSGQILDRVTGESFPSLEVSESKGEMKERKKKYKEGGRGGDRLACFKSFSVSSFDY